MLRFGRWLGSHPKTDAVRLPLWVFAGSIVLSAGLLFSLSLRVFAGVSCQWFGLLLLFLLVAESGLSLSYPFFASDKRRWVRRLSERLFPVPDGVAEQDIWRVRIAYGLFSFAASAAALVTFLNWVEFTHQGEARSSGEFQRFFLMQASAILFLIFLYYLVRNGRWRWAGWGFDILMLARLFGESSGIVAFNDLFSLFAIPIMLSIILLGWRVGVAYGALVLIVYAWFVPPGSGEFNYFAIASITLTGVLSYFLTGQLRAVLRYQRLANLELQLALQELQESKKKLELVVLGVSHEIRTPLAIIGGAVSVIRMTFGAGEILMPLLDGVEVGLNRLSRLAREMNDMAQGGSAGLDLNYEPVNLLDAVIEAFRDEKDGAETIAIEVGKSITLDADRESLQQMLGALIQNACLHGGGRVKVSARVENKRVTIAVSDEGEGIPEGELPRVFIPFMRGDRAIGKAGRGMGLTLTRLLAEAHGGGAWIESEAGKGCQAFVRLPLRQGANRRMANDENERQLRIFQEVRNERTHFICRR